MRLMEVVVRTSGAVPLMAACVPAGFPSPADDYEDKPLDFNELLIRNRAATFAVRAQGVSMVGAGIHDGDICIVDRSVKPVDGSVIVALVNGEFTMKRLRMKSGRVWLHAENETYPDIPITNGTEFEIWGVITSSVRVHTP
jgi:DNA polymerase V